MKADIFDEPPVIQPPGSMTVESTEPKPLLYRADGTPLVRDVRIGFRGGNVLKVGPPDR